jgi:hypothetical protein
MIPGKGRITPAQTNRADAAAQERVKGDLIVFI